MAYQDNEKRQVFEDRNIADDRQEEQVLKGIQPKNQFAFRMFKLFRIIAIVLAVLAVLLFSLTFIDTFNKFISAPPIKSIYNKTELVFAFGAIGFLAMMLLTKVIFLRKAPFDDWVFEVAQRDLGTDLIFYTSKCLYIKYDIASAKEVDKKDFITKMSDLSIHYSYFYVNTFVDQQVIQVECTKKQPVPTKAVLNPEDDVFPNIIPVGLTINNTSQMVTPISWTLNTNNNNPNILETGPSVSFLIAGGTGCHAKGTEILMYDGSLKKVEDITIGDMIMGPDSTPREVLELHKGQEEMYEIETEDGDKHIVNKGHNLQLKDIETGEEFDMPVEIYIQTTDEYKKKVRMIKVC